MNNRWKYHAGFEDSYLLPTFSDEDWEEVDIPHNPTPFPFHDGDEKKVWTIGTYRKTVSLPAKPGWERVARFEGVGVDAVVSFQGKTLATHQGAYTPFDVVLPDEEGMLVVKVDTHEDPLVPPFGGAVDYLAFGGIYRNVTFLTRPIARLDFLAADSADGKTVSVRMHATRPDGIVRLRLRDGQTIIAQSDATLSDGIAHADFSDLSLRLWDVRDPCLYQLDADFGEDHQTISFGARKAEFTFNGFSLNGKRIKLVGLDRHQNYPYVGYAMPEENQAHDAEMLKAMGLNIVRTSHYPQSPAFLDACDRVGLLVLEEIPGWQHIGSDPLWRERCMKNVEDMIRRDINHPSIVLWGVRINESLDDDELYRKTNALAHQLDPVRQTCGVRNFLSSNLLEDVYTYNDFSHAGTGPGLLQPRVNAPYLVTEHNGHMFPTKRFDAQMVRTEQYLRHMAVLESAFSSDRISGAIGWCFVDYPTHSNFGSGDGICYHGVCDQNRYPKFAAYAYISQQEKHPVLVSSQTFDAGDTPAMKDLPWVVATNCDFVNLYRDGRFVNTFYPARKEYPHVPHPPVFIDDPIGETITDETKFSAKDQKAIARLLCKSRLSKGTFTLSDKLVYSTLCKRYHLERKDVLELGNRYFGMDRPRKSVWKLEGVIGKEVVASEIYGPDQNRVVRATPERTEVRLRETYQVIPVILTIGKEGMTLPSPYAFEPYLVETEGPLSLLSPVMDATIGGVGGIYVRTTGASGTGIVRIKLQDQTIQVVITIG